MSRTGPLALQMIPLASVCGLTLAGLAASFLALWRIKSLLRAAERMVSDARHPHEAAIGVLQQGLESLRSQVHEARQIAPGIHMPPAPRAGFNLDKRSQALRLHRRGEAAAQIATQLEIPLQEVELLLKVHRIVLRSI